MQVVFDLPQFVQHVVQSFAVLPGFVIHTLRDALDCFESRIKEFEDAAITMMTLGIEEDRRLRSGLIGRFGLVDHGNGNLHERIVHRIRYEWMSKIELFELLGTLPLLMS